MDTSKAPNFDLIVLKKIHLVILIGIGILTPLASGYTSYQSAIKEVGAAKIEAKFSEVRLSLERDFVKKDAFDPMQKKINTIAEDVARLTGYLLPRGK